MKRSAMALASALLAAAVLPAPAQEKKDGIPAATYKVEFRIRDGSDAAAKDGRRYTMLIDTTGQGTFHVGDRVPVATGSFQPGVGSSGANTLVNTQFHVLRHRREYRYQAHRTAARKSDHQRHDRREYNRDAQTGYVRGGSESRVAATHGVADSDRSERNSIAREGITGGGDRRSGVTEEV